MTNTYKIGKKVRLTAVFSVSGVNTDPTTITCKVKDPSDNIDSYYYASGTVTRSATGTYYKDITFDEGGIWWHRWEGTGAVETADEEDMEVSWSEFP